MAETTPTAAPSAAEPKQICEKCRIEYALGAFQHGVADQTCVCKRCLIVMGYKVK